MYTNSKDKNIAQNLRNNANNNHETYPTRQILRQKNILRFETE